MSGQLRVDEFKERAVSKTVPSDSNKSKLGFNDFILYRAYDLYELFTAKSPLPIQQFS
jgi:hypothetical protein